MFSRLMFLSVLLRAGAFAHCREAFCVFLTTPDLDGWAVPLGSFRYLLSAFLRSSSVMTILRPGVPERPLFATDRCNPGVFSRTPLCRSFSLFHFCLYAVVAGLLCLAPDLEAPPPPLRREASFISDFPIFLSLPRKSRRAALSRTAFLGRVLDATALRIFPMRAEPPSSRATFLRNTGRSVMSRPRARPIFSLKVLPLTAFLSIFGPPVRWAHRDFARSSLLGSDFS